MAKALTGGDPGKIEEMRDAFKKGFDQATKSWGQALPEISSKTYDAVMEGFDNWANESQTKVEG
jgi:phage-related tail protein